MRTTFRISEDEFTTAMKLAMRFSSRHILMFFVVMMGLAGTLSIFETPIKDIVTYSLSATMLLLFVTLFFHYFVLPLSFLRQYGQNKILQSVITMELLEDGNRTKLWSH